MDLERRNLFADGGIRLSSTSNNSWMSKISIFMHVARSVFQLDREAEIARVFEAADARSAEIRGHSTHLFTSREAQRMVCQGFEDARGVRASIIAHRGSAVRRAL